MYSAYQSGQFILVLRRFVSRARHAQQLCDGVWPRDQPADVKVVSCLYAAREALGDFLKQPAIAVRITERGVRAIAAMLGMRTADPNTPEQVGLVRAGMDVAGVVERLADRLRRDGVALCEQPRYR